MAEASSSAPFFGVRDEEYLNQLKQRQQQPALTPPLPSMPSTSAVAAANQQGPGPVKKKRNLPGNPNPDAEVIALSPKTLMATNRFICEVCNKGFQREQNLQLHRRGHNLPWKLKQKSTKEVRRRVYLCPEPTCVHHDPSRALGDLTGIKKHFCRKHGEKKWKCDKCSKRYAVQSDWKAHSKTCGTREYRCDCGTLFSRRDSFITHRAFCDALAQESTRLPTGLTGIGSHLYGSNTFGLGLSQVNPLLSSLQNQTHSRADLLRLGSGGHPPAGAQFEHLISTSNPPSFRPPHPPSSFFLAGSGSGHDFGEDAQSHQPFLQTKPYHGLMQLPDLQPNSNASSGASAAANVFNLSFFSNGANTRSNASNHPDHLMMHDQFSTGNAGGEPVNFFSCGNIMNEGMHALFNTPLQNDSVLPQMSATALLQKAAQMGATSSNNGSGGGATLVRTGFENSSPTSTKRPSFSDQSMRSQVESNSHLHDIMNSFADGNSRMFGGRQEQEVKFGDFINNNLCNIEDASYHQSGLTRDFLGVGSMLRSMGGGMPASQREQRHGGAIDIEALDADMKSASSGRSFASGSLR